MATQTPMNTIWLYICGLSLLVYFSNQGYYMRDFEDISASLSEPDEFCLSNNTAKAVEYKFQEFCQNCGPMDLNEGRLITSGGKCDWRDEANNDNLYQTNKSNMGPGGGITYNYGIARFKNMITLAKKLSLFAWRQ